MPCFQTVELILGDLTEGAHAVATKPTGFRMGQHAREPPVIGEEKQAFRIEIEPADRDEPRQAFGQRGEDRGAPLGVLLGRHQARRLVIKKQARALFRRQRDAIDENAVARPHENHRRRHRLAVERDAAFADHALDIAARGDAGAGDHFRDALACLARRRRGCFAVPIVMPGGRSRSYRGGGALLGAVPSAAMRFVLGPRPGFPRKTPGAIAFEAPALRRILAARRQSPNGRCRRRFPHCRST